MYNEGTRQRERLKKTRWDCVKQNVGKAYRLYQRDTWDRDKWRMRTNGKTG